MFSLLVLAVMLVVGSGAGDGVTLIVGPAKNEIPGGPTIAG